MLLATFDRAMHHVSNHLSESQCQDHDLKAVGIQSLSYLHNVPL